MTALTGNEWKTAMAQHTRDARETEHRYVGTCVHCGETAGETETAHIVFRMSSDSDWRCITFTSHNDGDTWFFEHWLRNLTDKANSASLQWVLL
jgi:hypothetical protein